MENAADELGYPRWVEPFAYVVLSAIVALLVWLAWSFMLWEYDPSKWSVVARAIYLITVLLVYAAALVDREDDADEE